MIRHGVLAVLLAATLAGCSTPTTGQPTTPQGSQMTLPIRTQQRVDWDLSEPRTPAELGGRSTDVVAAETLGVNGLDVAVTLPGGDLVEGAFGLVTGDSGGGGGAVRYLSLATTQLHDGSWDGYVDGFVRQFGGDRDAVTAYLDATLPALTAGQVDPGRYFPGDARPGYAPTLQVRPAADGVVIAWQFALT